MVRCCPPSLTCAPLLSHLLHLAPWVGTDEHLHVTGAFSCCSWQCFGVSVWALWVIHIANVSTHPSFILPSCMIYPSEPTSYHPDEQSLSHSLRRTISLSFFCASTLYACLLRQLRLASLHVCTMSLTPRTDPGSLSSDAGLPGPITRPVRYSHSLGLNPTAHIA